MEEIHASEIASGSAMFFHGNVYWLALINSGQHKNRSIIAFSLRKEKFQDMELPIIGRMPARGLFISSWEVDGGTYI